MIWLWANVKSVATQWGCSDDPDRGGYRATITYGNLQYLCGPKQNVYTGGGGANLGHKVDIIRPESVDCR